jgi:hypothetical protein
MGLCAPEGHDLLPFTGQSAVLVRDVVPAAELVTRLVRETETALRGAGLPLVPSAGDSRYRFGENRD